MATSGGRDPQLAAVRPHQPTPSSTAAIVDELTKNRRETFDDLRFRLRWPGIEHSPFLAASNPGSIGHGWVKKLWVERDFQGDDIDAGSFGSLWSSARRDVSAMQM